MGVQVLIESVIFTERWPSIHQLQIVLLHLFNYKVNDYEVWLCSGTIIMVLLSLTDGLTTLVVPACLTLTLLIGSWFYWLSADLPGPTWYG